MTFPDLCHDCHAPLSTCANIAAHPSVAFDVERAFPAGLPVLDHTLDEPDYARPLRCWDTSSCAERAQTEAAP